MSYNKETGMYEGYIYKIYNDVNDKLYYGQTTTTLEHRWGQHMSKNNAEKLKSIIYRAIEKYGKDKFHIVEVEKHQSFRKECLINILNEREVYYINIDNTLVPNGYNMTYGGNNHSNSTKEPIDVYSIDGKLLQQCESIHEASILYKYDNKSINDCCNGIIVPKNGYIFRYHGDPFNKYRTNSLVGWNKIHIFQFDIDTKKLIAEYDSLTEAYEKTGINDTNILRGLYRNDCTAGGYYWSIENKFDYIHKTSWFVPEPKRNVVCAYDFDGNLIYRFNSQFEAVNTLKLNCSSSAIGECCNGKQMYVQGYVWRYDGDPFDKYPVNIVKSDKSPIGYISANHCKSVDCYDVYGNYITSFGSMTNASIFCNGDVTNIINCCNNKTATVCSLVFRYSGDSFFKFIPKYTWKDEVRKIDIYNQNGMFIKTINNVIDLVNDNFIKKPKISSIFAICNNTAKYNSIKKYTFRWHGDSFENPGSIDTYPHPDYQQLFENNPDAIKDDVINLLKQSLDNVGMFYNTQQAAQSSAERTRNIVDDK